MDKVINLITTFLGNTNYINFFSIIVVALTTYQVAKYNASKPNKLKVKQAQLDNVYLPLYRISLHNQHVVSLEQAVKLCEEIDAILDEHYVLAFPQLHTLNKSLKVSLSVKSGYVEILKTIFHQVSVDYELLKKALGYPSENFYSLFIRMTKKQKYTLIISWFNVLAIFSPMLLLFYFLEKYQSLGIIFFIAIYVLVFVCVMKLNNLINQMPD